MLIIIRLVLQIILLPIRFPAFVYYRFQGRHSLTWILHELKGEMSEGPVTRNFMRYFREIPLKFYEILLGIDRLAQFQKRTLRKSKKIREFTIIIHDVKMSWSQAWEYREAIKLLKSRGITTRAFLLSGMPICYYLASAAEKIYMPPANTLIFTGIRAEPLYFKSLLAKLAIRPDFITIGKFKSAPERYTAVKPSPQAERQLQEITDTLYREFLHAVISRTGLSEKEASELFSLGMLSADQAKEYNLINEIIYQQDLEKRIEKENDRKVSPLYFDHALHTIQGKQAKLISISIPEHLALVVAEGIIMHGKEPNAKLISYHDYHDTLESVKESNVSAAILRINSPGGAADVSDLLWKDFMNLKEIPDSTEKNSRLKKKFSPPLLYVSQSSVAASGGYYLSAICDNVFATPLTITGSIGVFAGKFNISGLLEKLGVSFHAIQSGENSDIFSSLASFSPKQKKILMKNMQNMYELFIDRICKGRSKTPDSVYPHAEGKIFSGEAALKNKLVDYSGGLLAAIEKFRTDKNTGDKPIVLEILPQIKAPLFSRPSLDIPGLSIFRSYSYLLKTGIWFMDPRL